MSNNGMLFILFLRSAYCEINQPIKVSYTCEHCGEYNQDAKQTIRARGVSRLALFHVSQRMTDTAQRRAEKDLASALSDVEQNKFKDLHLTCRCKKCGKRQLWSSFVSKKALGVAMCLFIVCLLSFFPIFIVSVVDYGISGIKYWRWEFFTISVIMLSAYPLLLFFNRIKQMRISKRDEKSLPFIELKGKKKYKNSVQ